MTDDTETQSLTPGLYIVATPIGNLGDITLRALETLKRCDAVACEDTRVTGRLLNHFGIRKTLIRYDDHASDQAREALLSRLETQAIVLVSDAGTPLVSDPGFKLVREARARQLPATSIPGPSAVITAITLSGLPTDRFLFAGFLPQKEKARRDVLLELGQVEATLVFFESGPRLVKSLDTVAQIYPDRQVSVCRELTKFYEEARTGTAEILREHYGQNEPRGEIVLLISSSGDDGSQDLDVDGLLSALLEHEKPSRAAAEVSRLTGLDRKELYNRAMELKAK